MFPPCHQAILSEPPLIWLCMDLSPPWLHRLAWAYIVLCCACVGAMPVSFLRGHRQKMWIMYLVWPITALYFGPVAVWLYLRSQRMVSSSRTAEQDNKKNPPTRQQVALSVFHCGAGCTLGDVLGEWGLFALGGTATRCVGGSAFATKLLFDFVLAYLFGIFFQYFTIVPLRSLSPGEGILAAIRADTISIAAFEMGMFVWMAVAHFVLFPNPQLLLPNTALFWFMMQIAMMIGWATSYPANLWLLRKGWKEKMS